MKIQGLGDKLPSSLGMLKYVESIQLQNNQFTGTIPNSLSSLSTLKLMSLRSNRLSGKIPLGLYNMDSLTVLNLSSNRLLDTIPEILGSNKIIQNINLADNSIFGEIPIGIEGASNLVYLDLSLNVISGEIPSEIGRLIQLNELKLVSNKIIGGIPISLLKHPELANLWLDNNELTEPIPPTSLGPKLNILTVQDNLLTFEDLIHVVDSFNTQLGFFRYAPQKTAGERDTFSVRPGCPVEMELSFDDTVTTSTYYWFRDGQPFDTVVGTNELRMDSMYPSLAGSYHAEIVNPLAPDLRLETYPFLLTEETCPVQEIRLDTTICAGEVLQYLGQEYDQEGVYRDTLIRDCCPEFVEINLSQYAAPDFDEERSFDVCQDSVLELRWTEQVPSEGDWTANWQSNEGEIISDSVDWWPEVRGEGVYYVALQDRFGCLYQDSVTVQQYPSLSLATLEGDTFCMDERYQIDWLVSDDADSLSNIQWSGTGIEQGATAPDPSL